MRCQLRLGGAVLLTFVWLSTAMALEVFEQPEDAGDLPNNAQVVTEMLTIDDPLLNLNGRISSPDDADMYQIVISRPDTFSATTIVTQDVSIEDSQLFLFDEEGRGICANEDNPDLPITDPTRRLAALPQGACPIPEPGIYFLAISTSVRDPIDAAGNDIFPDPPTDEARREILQPIDPNAVINDWVDPGQMGNYVIQIAGNHANFPPPECTVSEILEGPDGQRTVSLQVRDEFSGLASIIEVPGSRTTNIAEVIIPDFPLGATAVTVSAIDSNPFTADRVEVEVINTEGISIICSLDTPQEPEVPEPEPSCVDVSLDGVPEAETTVQDLQSGLSRIELLLVRNATVTVNGNPLPTAEGDRVIAFDPPTTEPVSVRAEKIDLNEPASVRFAAFDNRMPEPTANICDFTEAGLVLEQLEGAGDIPDNAQVVMEQIDIDSGQMRVIGRIESLDDADMYQLEISIPSEFSATTLSMPEVSIEDSQLFLFDAEGRGICANEDNPVLPITDPTRRLAALPLGACQIPAPGSYFLAISTSVRDPIDINGNDLFPDPVTDEERGMILQPIDPDAVINGWSGSGQIGNYAMLLTGVNYPSPECTLPQIVETADGQRTVSLRVRDVVLGIASIEEVPNSRTANIAEVIIPVFPPGAVEVTVSAIDTNPFTADQVEIRVTNTVGGSITCTLNTPQAPQ